MAVEKAGEGKSDTCEFVTGPFSVTFNVRIRIPKFTPHAAFAPPAASSR
jgi:hypothetical protein